MVDVDKAIIADIKKDGEHFEILVDCDKAIQFKKGEINSVSEVLATDDIFKDVKKGLHASEHDLSKLFGTDDKVKVAEIIIKEGHIHLTADYKKKEQEERIKQIITIISRDAINPQTNAPHPFERIEAALNETKVNIDAGKSAEEQVQDVVKALQPIIPIKFETRKIEFNIPAQYAGASYSILKKYGTLLKDEWQNDGSLLVVIEITAGIQEEFFDKLNGLTHGSIISKVVE